MSPLKYKREYFLIESISSLALCLFDIFLNLLNERSASKLPQAMHKHVKAILHFLLTLFSSLH
jgi:hypothetical protein